jgi:DNA-binding CsgD family transcriptional regulator
LPLRGGASMPPHGLALVFFRRHDAQLASAPQLRSMFGLTRKDSEICVGLANGQSLEEIAVCLGIGKGTARTHLKNCMTKTGTSRQAHLVSRVLLGSWLPP